MMVVVNELHCLTLLRPVTVGFTVLLSNVNPKSVGGGHWDVRQIGEHQSLNGERLIGQHQPQGKTFSKEVSKSNEDKQSFVEGPLCCEA